MLTCLARALADVLYIYPFKVDKKTFDDNKDELGFSSKIKVAKYKKTKEDLERERVQKLKEEENAMKGKSTATIAKLSVHRIVRNKGELEWT